MLIQYSIHILFGARFCQPKNNNRLSLIGVIRMKEWANVRRQRNGNVRGSLLWLVGVDATVSIVKTKMQSESAGVSATHVTLETKTKTKTKTGGLAVRISK
jgi:hypothetical protein